VLVSTTCPFNGLARGTVPGPVARNQQLTGGWQPRFRTTIALFGNNCSPVVPQPFSTFSKYTDLSSLQIFMEY
jgi:hypothetical protein